MTIARNVRWASAQSTSGVCTTASQTPSAGDNAVIYAVMQDGVTPTFSHSLGWPITAIGNWGPSTGGRTGRLWAAYVQGQSVTANPGTFTCNNSGGLTTVGATSYTGLAASQAFDRASSPGIATGASLLSPTTLVTSFPNELIVGFALADTATPNTWAAGGTFLNDGSAGSTSTGFGYPMLVESKVVSAQAGYAADATWTTSVPYVIVCLTFADTPVPASGSATGPLPKNYYVMP